MEKDLRPAVREAVYSTMKTRGIEPTPENYLEILHEMLPKLDKGEDALFIAVVAEITHVDV